jgi:hypothetical protein
MVEPSQKAAVKHNQQQNLRVIDMTVHAKQSEVAHIQSPGAVHGAEDIPVLLTVKQFAQKHPAFPEGGLRHRIFHANSNGLAESGALVRNLKRVYLDEAKFFAWIRGATQ